ncbi:hypothetical protein KHA90_23805 [Flavobacterium psychroterrae]|uniref:Uncharacterized protein n=1 Tax=Flavobacterium psychroterrae TaxID=2133767 RepID=A0ABS5PKL8_9FLAO|nr:hypothetical protein [Flavobacterium psychroterrae]MBS7234036.1 hypothetical protein [Flavobacterium psychroterrae]
MNTNNLSEETEEKLIEFFSNTVEPKSFAKALRQLSYLIALNKVSKSEPMFSHKENLEKGFCWLVELAEILNPDLEV